MASSFVVVGCIDASEWKQKGVFWRSGEKPLRFALNVVREH
jgi:hypothetical protein